MALPYHLTRVRRSWPAAWPCDYVDEMEARVAAIAEERGRIAAALADLPVETWPSDANFILFRPLDRDGRRGLARPRWTARCSCETVRAGRASPAACGSRSGLPEENDRFLAALTESLR